MEGESFDAVLLFDEKEQFLCRFFIVHFSVIYDTIPSLTVD